MMSQILSSDISFAMAMTIIHSVWQISLAALLMGLVLRLTRDASASFKYGVSIASMGLAMLAAIVTFSIYYLESAEVVQLQAAVAANATVETSSGYTASPLELGFVSRYGAVIVTAWIIGSLLFLARFTGAYLYLLLLIKKAIPAAPDLSGCLKSLRKKYNIRRRVIIRESMRITSPLVTGYIRPVILFPVGLINQLSMGEVEAILAHELAHIKRHDFIVNLLQSLVEILFYYHPAVWYMSARIRFERENCCDDMAIEMTGNSVSYARTLVKLQDLDTPSPVAALAFSGDRSQFSNRILRILNLPVNSNNMRQKIMAIVMVFITAFAFAKNMSTDLMPGKLECDLTESSVADNCPVASLEKNAIHDTIPQKEKVHITKKTDHKEVELEMENGNIKMLKIDGKEIPPQDYDAYDDIIVELQPANEKHEVITIIKESDGPGDHRSFNGKRIIIEIDSIVEEEMERHEKSIEEMERHIIKLRKHDLENMKIELEHEMNADEIRKHLKDIEKGLILDFESAEEFFRHGANMPEIIVDEDVIIKHPGNAYFFRKGPFEKLEKPEWNSDTELHVLRKINSRRTVADVLTDNLLDDRLIRKNETYELELSGKHMKINGEKQPTNIWEKYKDIYEEQTGMELTKKSRLKVNINAEDQPEEGHYFLRKNI